MSAGPPAAWHGFCREFKKVAAKIAASHSVQINSEALREEVKVVARLYMHDARPVITRQGFEHELETLNEHFGKLYELADARSSAASYRRQINAVRKALPKITTRLEMEIGGADDGPQHSAAEIQIIETLQALVPTAGLSYQQAIRDLSDNTRVSFRGPATELREVLCEVLDHLAPDVEVESSEGYRPEKDQNGKDRTKPTMKQKVRFILKAREQVSSATELPERAVEAVDGLVGGLTRSVYNFGSVVTHVAGERQAVVLLKKYIEVVLTHLLEL